METVESNVQVPRLLSSGSAWKLLITRMIGIARIRPSTIADLKQDTSRTTNGQALLVAVLVGLSLGLGEVIAFSLTDFYSIAAQLFYGVLLVLLTTIVWTGVLFLIGTRIFKGTTDFLGLARPIFFSVTPGLFLPLTSLPLIQPIVAAAVAGWVVVINVFATRQLMSLNNQRSILTVLISAWIMVFAGGTLGVF